jgi:hypothetical protein
MTTRIECTCPICTANATRLGKVVLAAEITDAGLARLSRSGTLSAKTTHGVVHAANHPQLGPALARQHTAYWAV